MGSKPIEAREMRDVKLDRSWKSSCDAVSKEVADKPTGSLKPRCPLVCEWERRGGGFVP